MGADAENKYVKFLEEVAERTGRLVALWQSVGFVHGVLNTDNMSILGETIDYGCAPGPLHPKPPSLYLFCIILGTPYLALPPCTLNSFYPLQFLNPLNPYCPLILNPFNPFSPFSPFKPFRSPKM